MKLAYSKIILHGVIASTFLMVSCQKKGAVRVGVKAGQAVEKPTNDNLDHQVDDLDVLNNPPQVEEGLEKPEVKTEEAEKKKTEAEQLADDVTTEKKDQEEKNQEQKGAVLPETVVTGPAIKECSQTVLQAKDSLNASIAKFSELYSKNADQTAMIKSSEEILKLCKSWDTTFTKEQENVVCKIGQDTLVKKRLFDTNCFYVGNYMKKATGKDNEYSLAHAKLQQASMNELTQKTLTLSKEAKTMLLQENLSWKAYIVEEQIQTDARKLLDDVKAKKVACTFNAKAAQYGEADLVKMKIKKMQNISDKNKTADIQTGVDLSVEIISGEGANAKATQETMTCANLNANYFNILDLRRALGSHFSVE